MQFDNQVIIRFPEHIAQTLSPEALVTFCPMPVPGEENFRVFEVQVEAQTYYGVLLDLPCIIESQKTLDYINYFKSADISQMLFILESIEGMRERGSTLSRMLVKGEKYKAKSGISPGTRNITSRFFRREILENPEEVRSVELLIKSVMESGSTKIVEEELVEFDLDAPIPDAEEVTYCLDSYKDEDD
mmetsp:Transcript_31989/g.55138  ORF Transcript_31989/g.55138 Transcript_31989/m.55138 type:complete len:188 (-) Transcript_31989:2154-2717(-)